MASKQAGPPRRIKLLGPNFERLRELAAERTRQLPTGSACRFWAGSKEGPGRPGTIRSQFFVLSSGEVVVMLREWRGCVAASHVEPAAVLTEMDTQEGE